MRRVVKWGVAGFLVCGALFGYRVWRREPPVNVLLITVDTLRPDRLAAYGQTKNATPNIDRLASEGALFRNAFCDVTWTTPSMSSVMTGTYATRHGMRSTYQQLDPANVTIAEYAKTKSYQTAAIVGSFPLAASFGLNQGFDTYDDQFTAPILVGGADATDRVEQKFSNDVDRQRLYQWVKSQADAYRPDSEVSDAAIAWLRNRKRGPFFLWVHYFGPHELGDLRLSVAEQDAKTIAVYDEDVRKTDTQVGRLLNVVRELGLERRTLVVFHADHGQSLGEHQYVGHGKNLYDPTLRIPMIVRLPNAMPAGLVLNSLARNVDILPTVLAAIGVEPAAPIDGESLFILPHPGREKPVEMYAETYLPATDAFAEEVRDESGKLLRVGFRRLGLMSGNWKLVLSQPWPLLDYADPPAIPQALARSLERVELHDLSTDPLELSRNVVTDRPDVVAALKAKIDQYNDLPSHGSERRELDDAAKERLRSLGYMH